MNKLYYIEDIEGKIFADDILIRAENSKQAGEIYLKKPLKKCGINNNFRLRITPVEIRDRRKYRRGNTMCFKLK